MEIVCRLAKAKFVDTKIDRSLSNSLKKTINWMKKNYTGNEWQEFRDKELWTIDVNDMMECNLHYLKEIYEKCY